MLQDERLVTYIRSLQKPLPPRLEEIARSARAHQVPIIRAEMQSFMQVLLTMKQPRSILEVGTAVGFSAIMMAGFTGDECRITSIEKDPQRMQEARKNITDSGFAQRITLLEGDAFQILDSLNGEYDFIFMDAAKGQYIHYYPAIMRLLSPGGLLVCDNVLQDGDILESHYAVERRNRTIYKRMRDYLRTLMEDERLVTTIVPIGDGAAVSVKRTTERKSI